MKWLGLLLAALLVGGSLLFLQQTNGKMKSLERQIAVEEVNEDPDDKLPILQSQLQDMDGRRTFTGVLLAISSAFLLGILFTTFVLPNWAGRVAEGIYGSGAELESTASNEALSLVAQGDYDGAIAAFRELAAQQPADRSPWLEISKIQRRQLDDPAAALVTLREGMNSFEWPAEDKAFFLFRLADVYSEDFANRQEAALLLRRVISEFPETRHSMNARHLLKDWGMS